MNGLNEAIKLAIEKGGYRGVQYSVFTHEDFIVAHLLDPQFWVALGRACGWEKKVCDCLGSGITCYSCEKWGTQVVGMDWKEYWHRFIDWIAEGKNTDDFFTNLIGKE